MIEINYDIKIDEEEFFHQLDKAEKFHGHLCGGMFTGVKMAMVAQKLMGYESFPDKDLIVVAEIDRCLTDAIMSVTGCRAGKRSMKIKDYGKFAATFCSLASKDAVRLVQNPDAFDYIESTAEKRGVHRKDKKNMGQIYLEYPWPEHFGVKALTKEFVESDLPGKPWAIVPCDHCHENVMDHRHIAFEGGNICIPCHELQKNK